MEGHGGPPFKAEEMLQIVDSDNPGTTAFGSFLAPVTFSGFFPCWMFRPLRNIFNSAIFLYHLGPSSIVVSPMRFCFFFWAKQNMRFFISTYMYIHCFMYIYILSFLFFL